MDKLLRAPGAAWRVPATSPPTEERQARLVDVETPERVERVDIGSRTRLDVTDGLLHRRQPLNKPLRCFLHASNKLFLLLLITRAPPVVAPCLGDNPSTRK